MLRRPSLAGGNMAVYEVILMERKHWVPVISAVALGVALVAPVAADEEKGTTETGQSMSYGTPTKSMSSEGMAARHMGLVGSPVTDREGQKIGRVSNVTISPSGDVREVVVSIGGTLGIGATEYRIPWNRVSVGAQGDSVMLGVPKNRVQTEFSAFEVKAQHKSMDQQSEPEKGGQ